MKENQSIPIYTISSTAEMLGISVPTLRMYEKEGLIIPYKKESNQRRYSQNDLSRIRCIRDAINKDKISIAGIKRLMALNPCWDIIKCSAEDRSQCAAIKDHTKPCWAHNHTTGICGTKDCRECIVYFDLMHCDSIKSTIVAGIPDSI